jgi:hypothetical protein
VRLAEREGCSVTSAKRSTESTLSGGVSDHWEGARHSYAVDLGGCDLSFPDGAADRAARAIATAFDLPGHTGVISAYRAATGSSSSGRPTRVAITTTTSTSGFGIAAARRVEQKGT